MTSLTARAEVILAQAKKLDAFLEGHGLPYPSFVVDPLDDLPADMQDLRSSLANESNDLRKLMRGAVMHTIDVAMSWTDAVPLQVIYHYKLASAVPLDGDASYLEIAKASGLDESLCRRFIRASIGSNIFDEDVKTGRVFHTASSRALVTDKQLYDAVGFQLEDVAPAALKIYKCWNTFGQDVAEQTRSAFSLENTTELAIYDLFAVEPDRGRRFGSAMGFYTRGDSWDMRHLAAAYDWKASDFDYPGTLMVDMGGGHGQISYFLARETKHLKFLVQDLPKVVEVGKTKVPEDLKDRVEFAAHSFFEPQPERDVAPVAFFLRFITHNWSDKYCIKILQALRSAMQPGSRILIYEYILEDGPVKDLSTRYGFQADIIMCALYNALERRRVDFERLLEAADSRFQLSAVRRPPGNTQICIVEIKWQG